MFWGIRRLDVIEILQYEINVAAFKEKVKNKSSILFSYKKNRDLMAHIPSMLV
jgi:hypothetical protein